MKKRTKKKDDYFNIENMKETIRKSNKPNNLFENLKKTIPAGVSKERIYLSDGVWVLPNGEFVCEE